MANLLLAKLIAFIIGGLVSAIVSLVILLSVAYIVPHKRLRALLFWGIVIAGGVASVYLSDTPEWAKATTYVVDIYG